MANVKLININKVYEGNVHAVHDFNIDIQDHEFIIFVGPSGCGKSTTLRMIAGLEEISSGDLFIDGKCVNNTAPKDRDIAMVFQSYALYPQMTVYENMAYALKLRKVKPEEIKKRVEDAANILGLTKYLKRKPRALSGGQRQRVALGRAIVRSPKVFLMDEPLSNLDAKLRVQMRSEIIRIHESVGATTIYVTHDQVEAMTMATRIVVMKDGFVQQIGTPNEIYEKPANMFVAGFIGSPAMNFIHGRLNELGTKFIVDGENKYEIPLTKEQQKLLVNYKDKKLVYGIRPEHIIYSNNEDFGRFSKYTLNTKIKIIELLGDILNCHCIFENKSLVLKTSSQNSLKNGMEIKVAINVDFARFYNATTTRAIVDGDNEYEEVEVVEEIEEIEEEKPSLFERIKKIFSKKKENKVEEKEEKKENEE